MGFNGDTKRLESDLMHVFRASSMS
jgi:hypothetical protein